jgi:regulator of protease activity HflC (stomatin/prohibitin superfamily)
MAMSGYGIMDIYSNKREEIQDQIYKKIKRQLGLDGIIIEGVAIRNVQFTGEFAKSVEEKQIAQQKAQKMEYVLEEERKEAERKEIEAQGKAKAIAIVSRELRTNPNYIKYLYVDKIADDVKVIVSDQSTIMDLKGLIGP